MVMSAITNSIPSPLNSIVNAGIDYYNNERDERIKEFHTQLLNGKATRERIEYEDEYIKTTEDSYFSLLSASVNDEEKEKSSIYANLYDNILRQKITNKKDRIKYLKMAKNLSYEAIIIISKIYIYKNFDVKGKENYTEYLLNKYPYEINLLEQETLITFAHQVVAMQGKFATTKDFDIVVELFFIKEALIPELYGLIEWRGRISFLFDLKSDTELNYVSTLSKKLDLEKNIRVLSNIGIERDNYIPNTFTYNNILVYVISDTIIQNKEALIKLSKIVNIIKITFNEEAQDQLQEIDSKLIYIDMNNNDSISFFCDLFER